MTTTETKADPVAEVRAWLEDNWDPDLTVAEWWERLGTAGWSAPTLPTHAYGRGLSRADAVAVSGEIGRFGALGPPAGLGLLLAAPTIATHGSQEQVDTLVVKMTFGRHFASSLGRFRISATSVESGAKALDLPGEIDPAACQQQ